MAANVVTLHTALTSPAAAARRRAMLLHPSNFISERSPGSTAATKAEERATRFEFLHRKLVRRGLAEDEARTEVARMVAREVWDGFADQLRGHRAAGRQMDANVLVVALSSLQGMSLPLARRRGDVSNASRAVSTALRRLQHNGGLLHRLHPHRNPAFNDAEATLEALETFLTQPQPAVACTTQVHPAPLPAATVLG